jgi:hypothetical protein
MRMAMRDMTDGHGACGAMVGIARHQHRPGKGLGAGNKRKRGEPRHKAAGQNTMHRIPPLE